MPICAASPRHPAPEEWPQAATGHQPVDHIYAIYAVASDIRKAVIAYGRAASAAFFW